MIRLSGSAYLDIMPKNWYLGFKKQNLNTKVIYFSINYDGFFKFHPKHKDDQYVLNLFNMIRSQIKVLGKKQLVKTVVK